MGGPRKRSQISLTWALIGGTCEENHKRRSTIVFQQEQGGEGKAKPEKKRQRTKDTKPKRQLHQAKKIERRKRAKTAKASRRCSVTRASNGCPATGETQGKMSRKHPPQKPKNYTSIPTNKRPVEAGPDGEMGQVRMRRG